MMSNRKIEDIESRDLTPEDIREIDDIYFR